MIGRLVFHVTHLSNLAKNHQLASFLTAQNTPGMDATAVKKDGWSTMEFA